MPLKVGELYATLKLDDSDFNRRLGTAGGQFTKFKSALATGVQTAATAFAATTTAVGALGIAALKVGVDYNRMQQSSRAALKTLLGSAEAANAQMDKLDDFARNSPFSKAVFIQAQQQLLGFGVAANDVIPALDAIQNAVASMGGGNEEISAITYALSQMQSQGKLSGETLRDLGVYGIDAATIVGEKMGKTGAEIRDMASKPGGIPVDQVWGPLVDGLTERFGGATDAIKQQFDGAVDRVKAAWRDIGSTLAAPFVDPQGGGMAVEWTNKFADAMRAAEAKAKPLVDLLVNRYRPALDSLSPALDKVRGLINSWDISKVNGQLDTLGSYAPLIAATSAALFAMGTNVPVLSSLGLTLNPVVAGFAALALTSPEVRDALGGVLAALQPLVPVLAAAGVQLADVLMYAVKELVPALGDLGVSVTDAGVALLTGLVPAASGLLTAAVPLIDVVASLARFISDLPAPLLAAGVAMFALRGHVGPVADGLGKVGARFRDSAPVRAWNAGLSASSTALIAVNSAAGAASTGLRRVGTSLLTAFGGPVGLAITGVTMALGAFVAKQGEIKASAESYKATLDDMANYTADTTDRIIEAISKANARTWLEGFFGQDDSILERAEKIGVATEDIVGYIQGEEEATRRLIEATQAFALASGETAEQRSIAEVKAQDFINLLDAEREALGMGVEEASRAAQANKDLGLSQDDAAGATRSHTDAIKAQMDLQAEAADATLSQAEALLREREAQSRASDAVREYKELAESGKATKDELTKAERRAEEAILASVRASNNHTGAMERNNASTKELDAAVRAQRDAFVKQRMAMGDSKAQAEKLADAYGLIPKSVKTRVIAEGASNAYSQVQALNSTLNSINGKTVTASVAIRQYGQAAMADGGFTSYADGKLPSEALIQSPRSNLVQWAEPETGGEAFIPLAPSKRARSLKIWEETGRRLGAFAVRAFADGGVNVNAPVTSSVGGGPGGRSLSDADVQAIALAVRDGAAAGTAQGFSGMGGALRQASRVG